MGLFDGNGSGGPIDYFRNRIDQWRAHPFQQIATTLAGGAGSFAGGPAAGFGASRGLQGIFDRYNNSQLANMGQSNYGRSQQQTNMDANSAMNAPLGDPRLGGDNQFGMKDPWQEGQMGPSRGGPDQSGFGGGTGGGFGGEQGMQSYGGPSMSGQQWMDRSGGYGNIAGQSLGVAPDQPSPFVNQILDSISAGPGLPGTGDFGQGSKHDQIMGGGMPANYGMSPMQVGGSNVIFGSPSTDMNSVAMANRRMWDH